MELDSQIEQRRINLMLSVEETVSLDQSYILSVCGTQSEPGFQIAVALSNYSCAVYSVDKSLSHTATLDHNRAPIVGTKFSPTSKNILYTATGDGNITACDLRAKGKVIANYKDNTEDGKTKPLASFDISCDERLIAGGSEHVGGDAFILFWDARYNSSKMNNKSSLLGGYWESHMDDVTCLTFHSIKRDILASGSTDGLMNIFDLAQPAEDLALMYSLNTGSSVDRLGWLTSDSLWCTTHTHALQLWNYEDASAYATFERSHLAVSSNDDPDNCYLVRFHATNACGKPFLLAGSSTAKGETLRCFKVMDNRLQMCHDIIGNKQVVRDSWMHEESGCLVTGGEEGIINVWQ